MLLPDAANICGESTPFANKGIMMMVAGARSRVLHDGPAHGQVPAARHADGGHLLVRIPTSQPLVTARLLTTLAILSTLHHCCACLYEFHPEHVIVLQVCAALVLVAAGDQRWRESAPPRLPAAAFDQLRAIDLAAAVWLPAACILQVQTAPATHRLCSGIWP